MSICVLVLTVVADRDRLEEMEALLGFQSRDLSVRELGSKFRLLVVLIVSIACRQLYGKSCNGCCSTNLHEKVGKKRRESR